MPTAAGLASSASGLASIAFGIGAALGLDPETDLTKVARLGSGSASRSLNGGLGRWFRGQEENGEDSHAQQIEPASHWPELRNPGQKSFNLLVILKQFEG